MKRNHHELPRERLARLGPDALTAKELMAVLLGSGVQGNNVFTLSEEVLKCNVNACSVQELQRIRGIGFAQACKIVAALSLGRRLEQNAEKKIILASPSSVFKHMQYVQQFEQEHFFGLYVDTRKQLLSKHLLFKGTVDATVVHPRDIFRIALAQNASGIIIVHNHPSGSSEPSEEDLAFTKQLIEVGELLHIPLLDHVIVGKTYWSFVESQ